MKRVGSALAFLGLSSAIFLLFSSAAFASSDAWWGSGFSIEELPSQASFLNGHKCENKTFHLTKITKNTTNPDAGFLDQYNLTAPETACGFFNNEGFIAQTRFVEKGDKLKGLRIKYSGSNPVYYPNNTTLFTSQTVGSGAGAYQYLSYKLGLFAGVPKTQLTTNSVDQYLAVEINATGSTNIAYADGSLVAVNAYGLSENGDWLVVAVVGKGLLRIHLPSGAVTPFSSDQRGTSINDTSFQRLSISNDGVRVLFTDTNMIIGGSQQGRKAKLYDLSGCRDAMLSGQLTQQSSYADSGCQGFDLLAYIQKTHPDKNIASHPWLHPTFPQLELTVATRNVAGSTTFLRLTTADTKDMLQGYLAMGDSFSSGEGDLYGGEWYEPGTDEQGDKGTFAGRNLCHVSRRSYPYLLAKRLGYLGGGEEVPVSPVGDGLFHSVACSGAVIRNVVGGGDQGENQSAGNEDDFAKRDNQYRFSENSPLDNWQPGPTTQIKSLNKEKFAEDEQRIFNPEVITIGIGGNDAKFSTYIKACVYPGTCDYAKPGSPEAVEVARSIADLKVRLTEAYKRVKATAPASRIYVHGYPQFVNASGLCALNVPFDKAELEFIEEGVRYMNAVVRASAQEAGVYYVDVEGSLLNRQLCSFASKSDIGFNGVTAGNDFSVGFGYEKFFCNLRDGCLGNESFHPNQIGHQYYASTIQQQTEGLTKPMPVPAPQLIPMPSDFFGADARQYVSVLNGELSPQSIQTPSELLDLLERTSEQSGSTLRIVQEDLFPNSTVTLTVFSDPIEIGEYPVGEDGVVEIDFTLPEELEGGVHELHLTGTDAFGRQFDYYEPIFVAYSSEDFDGDGVLDAQDSCPTIPDAYSDEDGDGIDDACDSEDTPSQTPEENPESENPEVVSEDPIDKGTPNPETVAGNEPRNEQASGGQVLGASTEGSQSLGAVLAQTGQSVVARIVLAIVFIITPIALYFSSSHRKYTIR